MAKYYIIFEKRGFICYTSHLDMVRLFNRAFKRSEVKLLYSQGYNPHPKIKFAQPLSLGYSSECEMIEFETADDRKPDYVKKELQRAIGESIIIQKCAYAPNNTKSFASRVKAAEYQISIPVCPEDSEMLIEKLTSKSGDSGLFADFMKQEKIIALKKQKKSKELKEIDIRPMIREFGCTVDNTVIILDVLLDAGSESNLNPELVITAFIEFLGISTGREEITVHRSRLLYRKK